MDFYNPVGGFILVGGMLGSVTNGPYCDARLNFLLLEVHCYFLFITSYTINCMFLTSLSPCEGLCLSLSYAHTVIINWLWL